MIRALLIALLALALAPPTAAAAVVEISVDPSAGADFGESHTVSGRVTGPYGAPLVGREVRLEIRRYPYRGGFLPVATARTGLDGRYAFEREFDRNHQVRVLATSEGDRSAPASVLVFPDTRLSFQLVRRNMIRVIQTYRVPADVRLTKRTYFYVGRSGASRAPLAARARTRRVRRGRYRASALVRLPQSFRGRFRYASCFPYNAGMGDPKLGCPRRSYRF